jgi:hypothetical protein
MALSWSKNHPGIREVTGFIFPDAGVKMVFDGMVLEFTCNGARLTSSATGKINDHGPTLFGRCLKHSGIFGPNNAARSQTNEKSVSNKISSVLQMHMSPSSPLVFDKNI